MCELLVKCVALIIVIHGLRAVCRRIGPRASGLILGLPSSTGIILFLCGRERGWTGAAEMAEASLLGLVAAVSLPLAYVQAVQQGWPLPGAIVASISAYFIVASGLGTLHPGGPLECLGIALGAILLTSILAARIDLPSYSTRRFTRSSRWSSLVRTTVPALYVVVVGVASGAASPRWAGLVSTFPSMSTVLLIVTHLEEGPAEASRIAGPAVGEPEHGSVPGGLPVRLPVSRSRLGDAPWLCRCADEPGDRGIVHGTCRPGAAVPNRGPAAEAATSDRTTAADTVDDSHSCSIGTPVSRAAQVGPSETLCPASRDAALLIPVPPPSQLAETGVRKPGPGRSGMF